MPVAEMEGLEMADAVTAVVARRGLDELTLNDVAAEAGVDVTSLARIYPTKAALARATFTHVFARSNDAVNAAIDGRYGVDAIRAFIMAVLPDDETKVAAARVLLPFWQLALHDDELAAAGATASDAWRTLLRTWLREAMADGDVRADVPVDVVTETVLNWIAGTQAAAIGEARHNAPRQLHAQVDALLDLLHG
ncbi:TetR/AcrR family transcriptional regulator [Zhihengliuella halotolerans]|nr:TetR family transcriptional regulator C-terminal domain-containing protein [Zhihengliuella halotolerans]